MHQRGIDLRELALAGIAAGASSLAGVDGLTQGLRHVFVGVAVCLALSAVIVWLVFPTDRPSERRPLASS